MTPSRQERLLFSALCLLEVALTWGAIADRRMVRGHDGFSYFMFQYWYLNDAAFTGEVPQWMPYSTQGAVATWRYGGQAAPLQLVWLEIAPLLKEVNFLTLFHLGLAFDRLMLMVGTWLLARRFLRSPAAVFFVAFTAVFSADASDQAWFNLRSHAALPLMLHFIHRLLETGRWRHLFAAGNLFAFQSLGGLPYMMPVTSWIVTTYAVLTILLTRTRIPWRGDRSWVGALAGAAASLAAVYAIWRIGTDGIMVYQFGRDALGHASLESFLTYGGNLSLIKWNELWLGVSPNRDLTLYLGQAGLAAIVLGIPAGLTRARLPLPLMVVLVLLLSGGTLLATVLYYVWPLMSYYRHLGLLAPFAKFFLCFLAGFGVDALAGGTPLRPRWTIVAAAAMLGVAGTAAAFAADPPAASSLTASLVDWGATFARETAEQPWLSNRLWLLSGVAGTVALLLGTFRWAGSRPALLAALVAVQVGDLTLHRATLLSQKTVRLDDAALRLLDFQPAPYQPRRIDLVPGRPADAQRVAAHPRARVTPLVEPGYGGVCCTIYSFLHLDAAGTIHWVDSWMAPLDRYMKAYWGQYIDGSRAIVGFADQVLLFPTVTHPASARFAGIVEDKIQFFSIAALTDTEREVGDTIVRWDYAGDVLVMTDPAGALREPAPPRVVLRELNRSMKARLSPPYEVVRFSANRLEVRVRIDEPKGAWMFYSDVWDPSWSATVNGRAVPVACANLAYKAVPLTAGENLVRLEFGSAALRRLYHLAGLTAAAWVGIVLWLAGTLLFRQADS